MAGSVGVKRDAAAGRARRRPASARPRARRWPPCRRAGYEARGRRVEQIRDGAGRPAPPARSRLPDRPAARRDRLPPPRPRRGARRAGLGADQQHSARRPGREQGVEPDRIAHLRHVQPLALLSRGHGMGAQPVEIDALDVGEAGEDRLQHGGAELGPLLHHRVDRILLHRGEAEPEVGDGLGRAELPLGQGAAAGLGQSIEPRQPFAVARVEQAQPGAGHQPQHTAQVMCLGLGQRHRPPLLKRGVDMQAGAGQGVGSHARS